MNDHNLDDLIIDNMEPKKNNKAKGFLTIVALLIVILIIAIILTKIILKDPNESSSTFEESNTEMIDPALTLQSVTTTAKTKEEPKLSEIIEDELNKPNNNTVKAPEPVQKSAPAEIPAPKVEQNTVESVEITKEFEQTPVHETVKPEVKEKPAPAVKKEVKAPAAVAVPESVKKKPAAQPAHSSIKYYIQVGAYTQAPSIKFLTIIKNSGFNYILTNPNSAGTKKLLIGPYPDRKSADNALVRVRDRINKSAFVVKK